MSAPTKSRKDLVAFVRSELDAGGNPRLTLTEVCVLIRFHRRTLQRYVDEKLISAVKVGPTGRVYMYWDEIKRQFPDDVKGI